MFVQNVGLHRLGMPRRQCDVLEANRRPRGGGAQRRREASCSPHHAAPGQGVGGAALYRGPVGILCECVYPVGLALAAVGAWGTSDQDEWFGRPCWSFDEDVIRESRQPAGPGLSSCGGTVR